MADDQREPAAAGPATELTAQIRVPFGNTLGGYRYHRGEAAAPCPPEFANDEETVMAAKTYTVTGMTCSHCVNSVTEEVGRIPGVTGVQVDLTSGAVTVTSAQPVDDTAVAAAVDEAGYERAR
ncbi:hypothetical protein GCM10010112_27070 [Actinoplanes lobatus]|uniref:HMA domain-containing protein n=2 Tax=Actinoplanes lobatus TaxID=113568 RepID=A0ABQ4AQP8_9ACTN|nr:hypothetical protein GCM10010112_27070 [Actinoplanes lobatus]GIE43331.1 hypothetical protein Alo02nite_62290 [Actinoplanes lobatus]